MPKGNGAPSYNGTPSYNPAPVYNPALSPQSTGMGYRVVVSAVTLEQQNQIRQAVPGAFRTTVNGQVVMQVGVFRDRAVANSLQQQLAAQNLFASILPMTPSLRLAVQCN